MKKALVATGAAVLTAALGAPALSSAAPAHHGRAVTAERLGNAHFQGVVVDQTGRPVDDVDVTALDSGDVTVASALTYARTDGEGDEEHGYFDLQVRRGTYTIELSKNGYRDAVVEEATVGRNETVVLDEITLVRKPVVTAAETSISPRKPSKRDKVGAVVSVVNAKGKAADEDFQPAGKVKVMLQEYVQVGGTKRRPKFDWVDVLDSALKATVRRNGASVEFGKIGLGRFRVLASYLGDDYHTGADAEDVEFTIKG